MKKLSLKGFTLLELIIAMTVLGILSTVIVVVVNPAHQLAKGRDSQRRSDIFSILSAVFQYANEHGGNLPDTDGDPLTNNFPTSATCIGTDPGCFNLAGAGDSGDEIVPVYLPIMPFDPAVGDSGDTGYTIYVDSNGRIVATATPETLEEPITETQ